MESENGGQSSAERQRQTAAEIARNKVLAVYSSTVQNLRNLPASSRERLIKSREHYSNRTNQSSTPQAAEVQPNWFNQPSSYQTAAYQRTPLSSANVPSQPLTTAQYQIAQPRPATPTQMANSNESLARYETPQTLSHTFTTPSYTAAPTLQPQTMLKDTPVNQTTVNQEWKKYHSAWQDYYQKYYNDYYSKAAQTYLATEKLKNERVATGEEHQKRNIRHIIPLVVIALIILTGLFLQYNRRIFAPIMAYVSPDTGDVSSSIEAVDPTITDNVSPDPRLIIPKINVDAPVAFGIPNSEVSAAMSRGVAHFSIPGANALPGQIGNLAISGHSAGDVYNSNPYKFIFSGLERLEVGDLIYVNYESTRYTYQMVRREVVSPNNVAALVYETDKPMLTLITCTPLGSTRYRLLITAEQISPAYDETNVAVPEVTDTTTAEEMPSNPPTFFESLWNGIFGN